MKTTLISSMVLPCLLVCFSVTGHAQELKPYVAEEYMPRENITGVGTNTVSYLLSPQFKIDNADGVVSHLKQYEAIESVLIDGNTITITTRQIISGNEINLIFDRLGMSFFQVSQKK